MQDQPTVLAIFLILAGAFSIVGSLQNWDIFFNNFRARIFVQMLGRQGARVFYILLGAALLVGGVLLLVN